MFPAGPIVDEIEAALRLHDADDVDDIWHSMNIAYYELANLGPFREMREKITVDFSNADSENRMPLPPGLIGVIDVWDSDGKIQYFPGSWSRAEQSDLEQDDHYKWFFTESVTEPLLTTSTADISKGDSTFTMDPVWSSTYLNEYIRFSEFPGFFKLTGDKAISPAYNGDNFINGYAEIRPMGTPRFSVRDRGDDFESTSVIVYLWQQPRMLCNRYDMILLPDTQALELKTMIRVLGEKDKKSSAIVRWEAQLIKAEAMLRSKIPAEMTPRRPIDRWGREVVFGKWRR